MVIGYIKIDNIESGFFKKIKGIEIRKFDNNYVIAISNKNRMKILGKYIEKLKINTLVFSRELENNFKEELCLMLHSKKLNVLNGKKIMQYMDFEIVKYILNKQNATMKQEDIYIVLKKDQGLDLNFLKRFIENFKTTNIVTNDIERLKNVQDNLLENNGILIAVSNNKKKALKRAKYIINVNLNKEELEKYVINRNSIIINLQENVKYDNPSFDGININYFNISCPDEYIEKFEQIGDLETEFDLVKLYESILLCSSIQKLKIEEVYERISKDDIKIAELIGNNGPISDEELQKIHKLNLDKMRKLV